MINLDDYLSTQDELFNTNAQYWYFEFSGNKKPNTEKPFDVFVKALHEVYFFIQDNLNKPFGCIEKINNVLETNGFNEIEKLILIDKILGILIHHPEQEKQQKVFIQLVDFRHDLSPYTDDPEIKNPNLHFDFEAIKTELATIEAPTEKHKFLKNLLFDYTAKAYEIDELEHEYYESIGLVHWIETELSRCEYKQLDEVTPIVKALPPQPITKALPPQPTTKQNNKLSDLITHQKSIKIVEGIKIQYKNIKGKRLKLLLLAFQDLELLPKERIAQKFYDSCKCEFDWDVASYNAMNGYNFNDVTDSVEFNNMKQYLETLIKTE